MITTTDKSALITFVNANCQGHLLPVVAIATNLARVSWINSFKPPASVLSFAFRHREKAPPSHVADCSGETAILDHPAFVQIFDRDRVKSPGQIARHLVMEILATARHFQMRLGYFDSQPRTPLRPLLFPRKSPLLSLQVLQRGLEMARILDLFAVREYGKAGNADLYSCPYQKVRPSFFSYTYRHPVLTVNLPLYTITLRKLRILIWKTVIGRMRSEVVENTSESSFGEAQ